MRIQHGLAKIRKSQIYFIFLKMFSELLNDGVAVNHVSLPVIRVPEEACHPPLGQNGHTKNCRWIPDDISWTGGDLFGSLGSLDLLLFCSCFPLSSVCP